MNPNDLMNNDLMNLNKGFLYYVLQHEVIKDMGVLAIKEFKINKNQTLDQDLQLVRRYVTTSKSRETSGLEVLIQLIKYLLSLLGLHNSNPEIKLEILNGALTLIELAKKKVDTTEPNQGIDTLLLVIPKDIAIFQIGLITSETLLNAIRQAHYFRCATSKEANELREDIILNSSSSSVLSYLKIIQIFLGKSFAAPTSKVALTDLIQMGIISNASVQLVEDLPPSTPLPDFMS